jgi:hypothetical protein
VLNNIFSEFGVPANLKTDNGPPFNSSAFADFATQQGFRHQKVTPKWAQANGYVERFMCNLGKVMRNAPADEQSFQSELDEFLRNYRSTPHSSSLVPPSRLLFKGSARTTRLPSNQAATPSALQIQARENDTKAKAKAKHYNDTVRGAKESTIQIGDKVLLLNEQRFKSDPVYERVPYLVTARNGSMCTISQGQRSLARNASLLKKVKSVAFWLPEPNEPTAPAAPALAPAASVASALAPAEPAAPALANAASEAPALALAATAAPVVALATLATQLNHSDVEDDSDDSDETLNESDLDEDLDSSSQPTTSEEEAETLELATRTTRSRNKPDWNGHRAPPKPKNKKRRRRADSQQAP